MNKHSFTSIRQRVLFLFLLVVLVPTFLIILVTGFFTRMQVETLVENNAFGLVQAHVQAVLSWRGERIQELRQLANTPRLKTLDWDYVEPYLQRQIRDLADCYLIFFLASPDGTYHTTAQRQAGNIADRSYFPEALAGNTVVSEPLISRSTGEKAVVIATPVWNEEESEVIGVLGLTISLAKIHENLANVELGHPDSYAFIVDKQGSFLVHPDPQVIMAGQIQDYYPQWPPDPPKTRGSFTYRQGAREFRAFFAALPGPQDWVAVVLVPTEYIKEPLRRLLFYLAVTALAGICLVFWIGTWFASTITNPIIELNEIFKRGSTGDLTVRAEVNSADEIGQTRASFNRMMDTIGTMTYHDPLTGLPNRPYFLDQLRHVLNKEQTAILALISIRRFSELKTSLGPDPTDKILMQVAQKLRFFQQEGTILGRVSEGEFALVISFTASGILKIIDRLEHFLKEPLFLEEGALEVRLRGGAVLSEQKKISPQLFYQQAQAALYEAERSEIEPLKLYDPQTHLALKDHVRFQTEIRTALQKKQFTLFYQPIIDLKARRIAGKEALIRWRHPTKGLLLPGDFIDAAEQAGFIKEMGEYVLRETCRHHLLWQRQHGDLGWVAVNISPTHFRSPHLPAVIRSALQNCVHTTALRLEITEEAMLSPTQDVLNNLQELQRMGIPLAIDDFGTAYSSLEYLAKYPVQGLKIDQVFIKAIDQGDRQEGLVRAIIALGQNLSLTVTAEGVERLEQLRLLKQMGCGQAQGFYFSRPIPWADYPPKALLLNKRLRGRELWTQLGGRPLGRGRQE